VFALDEDEDDEEVELWVVELMEEVELPPSELLVVPEEVLVLVVVVPDVWLIVLVDDPVMMTTSPASLPESDGGGTIAVPPYGPPSGTSSALLQLTQSGMRIGRKSAVARIASSIDSDPCPYHARQVLPSRNAMNFDELPRS
jgi:hypothetical protein